MCCNGQIHEEVLRRCRTRWCSQQLMNNEHIQLMEQTSFFPIIVQLLPQLALPLVMKAMETMDARIENVTFKNIQSVQARSPSIALPPLVSLSTRPRASVRSTFRSLVFCSLIFFARHRPLAPPLRLRFCPLVRLQRRLRITLRSKICLFVPLRSYRQLLLYSHNDDFILPPPEACCVTSRCYAKR